jgi:hypothetical protein
VVAIAKPARRTERHLKVIGCPLVGRVRAVLSVAGKSAGYTFRRLDADRVTVTKDDGESYTADLTAGTCTCPAGKFRRVEECRHVAASRTLAARGHL